MKKITGIFIAILIVAIGVWYVASQKKSSANAVGGEKPQTTATQPPASQESTVVKSFTVEGGNFKFTPNVLSVTKGDTVRITFKNTEGFHDLVIDEFQVRTKQIPAGQEETIQFVADKTGTFEYYCSVGSHRKMGMVGRLEVK